MAEETGQWGLEVWMVAKMIDSNLGELWIGAAVSMRRDHEQVMMKPAALPGIMPLNVDMFVVQRSAAAWDMQRLHYGEGRGTRREVVQQRETSKWYYYGCYRVVHSSYVPMAQVRETGDVLVCSVQCN